MKKYIGISVIALLLVLSTTGCSKDETELAAPTITYIEFGHDNSKTAYIGADLHVEAEVTAPGKIDNIKVEMHPEDGGGWEYSEVFREGFEGLLNANFHQHLPISEEAVPGEYHIHFIVTDKNGKQTSVEAHIEILYAPELSAV